jgi:hypothetical protein
VGVPHLVSEAELNVFGLTHPKEYGLTHLVVRFDPPVSILFSVLVSLSSCLHLDYQ